MNKTLVKKLDNLWALKIKQEAAMRCEVCGLYLCRLNSHHFISRNHRSLRWVLDNGFSLCVSHHTFGKVSAHCDPQWFVEYAREQRGEKWYSNIKSLKNKINKFSYEENLEMMDMPLEEIVNKYKQ